MLERLYPQNGTLETYLNNAGTADIGYDGMQRPIEMRDLRSDNSLIVGFTYTYDRMGNKLTEGKLYDPANSETYTYDSAYRLLTFNRAAGGIAPSQSQLDARRRGQLARGQRPVAAVLLDQRAGPERRSGRRPRDGHLRQQRQRDRRRHVPLHVRRPEPADRA